MTVSERDSEAVSRAIRILDEAGYRVEQAKTIEDGNQGVSFDLTVEAPTRTQWFGPQSEAVRETAIESTEYGMGGIPVEDGDSE